jgi:hypothetical protein
MPTVEDHQKGPLMNKQQKVGIAVVGFIVLAIIGLATGGGKATSTGNTSPIASSSALASTVASPTVTATPSVSSRAATATRAKAKPRKAAAPATPAPTTSKAVVSPPPPTTATAAAPATPAGCYPLTNGGNCYEPGEYCRNSDHGAFGVAGDGERIVCEDNNGWRWEPA